MSTKVTQSGGESITVEEGDLISDGPDNWKVHAVDGPIVPDDEIVLERYDGHREPTKRGEIGRCECGQLVLGGGQCYGCFKTGSGK